MTIIYVVTSGNYSDYGINAIFSTRELADAFVERYNTGDSYNKAEIEEWGMDDQESWAKLETNNYIISMELDGTMKSIRITTTCHDGAHVTFLQSKPNGIWVGCTARNEEYAIKIASERRTQLIVEGKLIA